MFSDGRVNKDITAKCPKCMEYVRWLMSARPVRVVDNTPGDKWTNHTCDVAHLYVPKKVYWFDQWGYGHEVKENEWRP